MFFSEEEFSRPGRGSLVRSQTKSYLSESLESDLSSLADEDHRSKQDPLGIPSRVSFLYCIKIPYIPKIVGNSNHPVNF